MDTSPTRLFDSYEQDFNQFSEVIRKRLDEDSEQGSPDERKAVLRRVEMDIDEADEMVSQMEIEIQGIPQSLRPQYQTRLRSAKGELASDRKLLKERMAQLARASLLSSSSSDEPYGRSGAGDSDRTRLLAGTQLLEDGTKRLQDSQRVALETEEQGAGILQDLRSQRETIVNSRNVLQGASDSIDKASTTLKGMIRRMYQQRLVTGAIIAILILLIVVVIWGKLS